MSYFSQLTTIQKHLEKFWIRYFISISTMLLVFSMLLRAMTPDSALTPNVEVEDQSWEGVAPGDVISGADLLSLGDLISQEKIAEGTAYYYKSDFPTKPNEVVVDSENRVVFIKNPILSNSNYTLRYYLRMFGPPNLELFVPEISDSVRAHVFLKHGVVIIAHTAGGAIEEKWRFVPTDPGTFLVSWGKDLSTNSDSHPEEFDFADELD
jgi:hypothetical protein